MIIRALIFLIGGAILGVGVGKLQSQILQKGIDERFYGARETLAEIRGDATKEEISDYSGEPKLEVEGGLRYNFGTMRHGTQMSHTFTVRNVGTGPLTLDMGPSTCKCTVGDLDESILGPGEDTEVTLTWTAQSILNDFGQSATVYTNDPENSEIQLGVFGKITRSFVIEPPQLALGDISTAEQVSRTFHIFCYLEDSKEIAGFEWTNENTAKHVVFTGNRVEVDPEKFPEHKNAKVAHEISVAINPGMPLGPIKGDIQFETDKREDIGTLYVPVSGTVRGDLNLIGGPSFRAETNLLVLGNVKASDGAKVAIYLAVYGKLDEGTLPEIVSNSCEGSLEVTVGEPKVSEKRTLYPIRFEVPKNAPAVYYPGNARDAFGSVVIKAAHENGTQELPIKVQLVVTE